MAEWIEGRHHGLVWQHGMALVQGQIAATAAREVWRRFASGGDLASFLKVLSECTGTDVLSLPPFAVALGGAGTWQLAARGPFRVTAGTEVVDGHGVSTWAERQVDFDEAVVVGEAPEGGLARPIVAGIVPAAAIASTVVPASTPLQCQSANVTPEVAVDPEATADYDPVVEGVPIPEAAATSADVAPDPAIAEVAADVAPGDASSPERASDGDDEVAAAVGDAPDDDLLEGSGDRAEDADPDGSIEPDEDDVPSGEPDEGAAVPGHETLWTPPPSAASAETLVQEQVALDRAPEPEPGLLPVEPPGQSERPDAAAEPLEAPPEIAPGRFARQYGDTAMWSVEDAAVRDPSDAALIEGVPASVLQGDHDGETQMMEAMPGMAPPAEFSTGSPDGDETVLAVECMRGHANPPQRPACSLCGAQIVGEPRRVQRPSLGRLLLPNGERIELTSPVIVGRNPRADRFQGPVPPQLVPLSQGHVSGTHLEIRLEGWHVLAVDMHSTNGTYLRRQGEAPVRLGERPELLIENDVLDLGHGVQIRVEFLR